MHLTRVTLKVTEESGMMIVQVVILSAVLLAVLFMGFQSVQTTIKSANTTATSAAFKDLVLNVEQTLAKSETCLSRLGFTDLTNPSVAALMSASTAGGLDVSVAAYDSNLPLLATPEVPGSGARHPEFRITEVKLLYVKPLGWSSALSAPNGTVLVGRVGAVLAIRAERRSSTIPLSFGSSTMTADIPIILGTLTSGPELIMNCSTRAIYRVELGPPDGALPALMPNGWVRKSGLECIDRGGSPVLAPDLLPGQSWYVCSLPRSSSIVCNKEQNISNLPGWYCYKSFELNLATQTGFSYAY